ncbi:proteasome component ecm29 [Colletotrichum plurivorum]|uniref:Proteasome component ecm29 n=1 Tax=Colletotrichum plurivorum TaxID=2175906 RepID=A0A8H6K378_9PEZI|nr:proteasome component ecm29 [Colletotrichum plurivorum]
MRRLESGRAEIRLNEGINLNNTKIRSIVGEFIVRKPVRGDGRPLHSGGSRSSDDPFFEAYEVIRSPTRSSLASDTYFSQSNSYRILFWRWVCPSGSRKECGKSANANGSPYIVFAKRAGAPPGTFSAAAGAVPARAAPGVRQNTHPAARGEGSSPSAQAMLGQALRFLLSPSGLEGGVDEVKMFSLKTILDITKESGSNLKPLSGIRVCRLSFERRVGLA